MRTFLDDLNPEQRLAVETTEGPVLILAGAGTGKTRAITYRMANLLARGVPAEAILAVTFTNKAAEQMQERLADLLLRAGLAPASPWISTFHSLCARLLRREAATAGLPRDFSIFDEEDQLAAVKLALARLALSEDKISPRNILSRISYAKNHGQTPEMLAAEALGEDGQRAARVFEEYERLLEQSKALDFDDLLLRAARVLRESAVVRERWQARFRYIHVDEYQDTNCVQYEVLRSLTGAQQNVCVVGDEDQAIYRWRGADVGILLRFAEDFPTAHVVRLERNYRSTQKILDAAGAVVANNSQRLGKSLRSEQAAGANVRFYEARDAQAEAEYVAGEVVRIFNEDPSQTCAVEYRTTFQSRAFEEAFRRLGVRYRLVGGFSFYKRAEVRDTLTYVRLALHPEDDVAVLRVLNVPPRGIGKSTLDTVRAAAKRDSVPFWTAIGSIVAHGVGGRAVAPLRAFQELIQQLQEDVQQLVPAEFLHRVLDRTGYMDMLREGNTPEDISRVENLQELLRAIAESSETGESLTDFLDHAALVSDADSFEEKPGLTLITLHSTKGLEFDHVFLTGLEEGIFPHSRSSDDGAELEEERRLCYVGMTRARTSLTLTRAVYRRIFGDEKRLRASLPSRFLGEIPGELVETAHGSMTEFGERRRYEADPEYSYSHEEFVRRVRGGPRESSRAPRQGRSTGAGADPLIGQRVRHPSFGLGTIIGVEGEDEDRRISVSFAGRGTKKFIERYAQLEPA